MTACYVQNRLQTRATDKTPYEMWNGEKLDLQHMRVFGSRVYYMLMFPQKSEQNGTHIQLTES